MKELTDNQKLRIARLGLGMSQTEVAKKLFLSISFIGFIEKGARKVPKYVKKIMIFDKDVKWYETIISALLKTDISEKDRDEAIQTLNKVLKI